MAAKFSATNDGPLTLSSLCFEDNDELMSDAHVNGVNAIASYDSGASHLFMSKESASACGMQIERKYGTSLTLGDDSKVPIIGMSCTNVNIDGISIPKLGTMTMTTSFEKIVEEYNDVFLEELPNALPPKRDVEFEINLKSDEPPPVRPVIRLSTNELAELKKQLQMYLSKGLIRPSSSPYGAPVFFIKKKSGDLRMVCDYRALNKITIQDSNPLPLISEALDQVAGANIFSKIDLLGAYHQMRIREEDCPKTAIRTRFGSFEWRVLCFGLTNAPASFSRLIASKFHELNGDCIVLFLDDLLIYSKL
eukprot:IDg22005t1